MERCDWKTGDRVTRLFTGGKFAFVVCYKGKIGN